MIDPTLRSSIAALLRLAEGASPLPWDNSKWYALYRVNDGSHRDWKLGGIPQGLCADCLCNPENKPLKTVTRNGENFHLHAYTLDKDELDYHAQIFSEGNGDCITPTEMVRSNSDYIVAAANLAPQLARLVLMAEGELSAEFFTQKEMQDWYEAREGVKFQPAPCVVFDPNSPNTFGVALAPEQESRLADAVADRVLRAMGREMQK